MIIQTNLYKITAKYLKVIVNFKRLYLNKEQLQKTTVMFMLHNSFRIKDSNCQQGSLIFEIKQLSVFFVARCSQDFVKQEIIISLVFRTRVREKEMIGAST